MDGRDAPFLHPTAAQVLEIDEDALALGVPFDQPEFFEEAIAGLQLTDAAAQSSLPAVARALRSRRPNRRRSASLVALVARNEPYAFTSNASIYRWYIDPLAKRRGIPQANLRGPKRAD